MMTRLTQMTLVLFLVFTLGLNAQEDKTITSNQEEKQTSFAQVTFFYPVGSNGLKSMDKINKFSFNVLWGMNGGVDGFELGGIGNYNDGNVKGFQLAGITNLNNGHSQGAIISGIANLNKGDAKGLQLSGITNINGGESKGLMLSGIANVANKNATGAQISLINGSFGQMSGLQLGLINIAKKMKGFQLGLVNISDTINGAALGLLNITRGGYFALEVSNSEALYVHTTYKMGVSHLYNIYTAGYGQYKGKDVFSYGLGLGTLIPIHKRHSIAIEGIVNQMAYDNEWNQLNMLNKLNLTYQFHITEMISIFGGPSVNFYITEFMVDGEYGTLNMPKPIWEHKGDKNMHYMWIGYNVGVNFKL